MPKKVCLATIQPWMGGRSTECNPFSKKFSRKALDNFIEEKVQNSLHLFEEAGKECVDVVCGSEDMKRVSWYNLKLDQPELFLSLAEPIPGPLTERIAKIAKKYEMYILPCFFEKENDKIYNTAVVIDRRGRIVGKYRKVHLPPEEDWQVTPENDFPVFETDFGKIGFMICWDIMFPEVATILALKGADVLFNPTAGFGWTEILGEATAMTRANDNHVFIVISKHAVKLRPGRSMIVNRYGQIIADAGYKMDTFVSAEVDIKEVKHSTYEPGEKISGIPDLKAMMTLKRRPETYHLITSKNPPLLSKYSRFKLATSLKEKKEVFEKMKREWEK